MNMVQEKMEKASSKSEYAYELLDKQADRAALLLYRRWSAFFDQMEENESFLVARMKSIFTFAEQVADDAYLRSIYLVFVFGRSGGDSVKTSLDKMEKLRLHFLEENKIRKSEGTKTIADQKRIESPGDEPKIKYLMRYSVAVRCANLIYERLFKHRIKAGDELLGAKFEFSSFPLMFEDELKRLFDHLPIK